MGIPIIRLVFDRRNKATKTTKGLLDILVSHKKRRYYGTGIRLYSHQWSDAKWVINSLDSISLNKTIEGLLSIVRKYCLDCIEAGVPLDFDVIAQKIKVGSIVEQITFLEFAENCISNRKDIEESTRRAHFALLPALEDFGKIKGFETLTKQNIMLWDDYLRAKKLTKSSIYGYHKRLKSYINQAIKRDYIKDNPYKTLSFERGGGKEIKYLTKNEIDRIKKCFLESESLNHIRDLFLFQCYTGLAYSDFSKFDFERDVQQVKGKYIVKDKRQKTKEEYTIVLLSGAVEILKRYDYKLPVISNVKYNLYLKALAAHAGLKKRITSHMGRHSFAVLALNSGVPIEVVAKMMGHADIKTTQIYAKVLDESVEEGFEKIEQKM